MTRRHWLLRWAPCLAFWPTVAIHCVSAADQLTATLNETLRSVLKCRRDEEFAFVDLVATKVEQGSLPLSLVLSMMKWARERRPELPFPYFQEGIKRRAAALGVDL